MARGGSRNVEGGAHNVGSIYTWRDQTGAGGIADADSYTFTQTEQSRNETTKMV